MKLMVYIKETFLQIAYPNWFRFIPDFSTTQLILQFVSWYPLPKVLAIESDIAKETAL